MVCSLTLCFLAASATDVRSDSRRIATICSSVNRLFRIGSSLSKEPFFQKLMDRKTSSGHPTDTVPDGAWSKCGPKGRRVTMKTVTVRYRMERLGIK